MNYIFLFTIFCLCKTIVCGVYMVHVCPCMWEIMHVKEQMCMLLTGHSMSKTGHSMSIFLEGLHLTILKSFQKWLSDTIQ